MELNAEQNPLQPKSTFRYINKTQAIVTKLFIPLQFNFLMHVSVELLYILLSIYMVHMQEYFEAEKCNNG